MSKHISWAQSTKQDKNPMIVHTLFPKVIIPPPGMADCCIQNHHSILAEVFGAFCLGNQVPSGTITYPPHRLKSALKRGHVIVTGGKSPPLKRGNMLKQLNRHVFNSPPNKRNRYHPPKKHKSSKPKQSKQLNVW